MLAIHPKLPIRILITTCLPSGKVLNKIIHGRNRKCCRQIGIGRQNTLCLLGWTVEFETARVYDTVVKIFKGDEGLYENVEKPEYYLKNLNKIQEDDTKNCIYFTIFPRKQNINNEKQQE